jgi:hypothetical protein
MLVFADSSMLEIREELGKHATQIDNIMQELGQQILERNEKNFYDEGMNLYYLTASWYAYLPWLTDLIDIHRSGQQMYPKQLYLVDIRIQDSKDRIAEYLASQTKRWEDYLPLIKNSYLKAHCIELQNTMKAVKTMVDSLDFLSVYE